MMAGIEREGRIRPDRRQRAALTRLVLRRPFFWGAAAIGCLIGMLPAARAVDDTWDYAVRVTAEVASNPVSIALSWPVDTEADSTYAPVYTIYRKSTDAGEWGQGTSLPPGQTSYLDTNVATGVAYEYQIVCPFRHPRFPQLDHDAYGYILAGIDVPAVENRGKVILVIEDRVAAALGDQVARLHGDLVGDGWTVAQIVVNSDDTPDSVRQRIQAENNAGKAEALLLLGHIPVAKAGGNTAPDGHDPRPLPCDAYYGDVDGQWTDANADGVLDQDTLPSDVDLEVGRIDFSEMQDAGTGLDDLGLTARYLDKDHALRVGQLRFTPRALISDRIGIDLGRAPAAGGYRAFTAMFGTGGVDRADPEDNAADAQRWQPILAASSYAWTFGSGGGGIDSIATLGTHGDYKTATSADLASSSQAEFYLLFGSFFIDWSQPDDLLRAALASPNGGLGAAWSGRPSFIFHRLALGDTIGDGVRLTQNNDGLFFSPKNAFRRGVHIAWMGDPTLRLNFVAPPVALNGSRSGTSVALSWQPPANADATTMRYLVYRAATPEGPFNRLTPTAIADLNFTDSAAGAGATYAVKVVILQQTASGTYENDSEAATWTDNTISSSSTPLTNPETVPADPNLPIVPALIVKGPPGWILPDAVGPFPLVR